MSSVSIGLDIGSSAVRAAEIEVDQGRRIVRRYGQVGLEPGWVVDGEIVNAPAVSDAIRRLWSEVRFRSTDVVVGVSGPRVFVRQAEVPGVDTSDLRSSLRFNASDLLPIPLEETSFDFSVLAKPSGPEADEHMRLLLVAAHKDTLHTYVGCVEAAGLRPVAIDATPLALLRAVPPLGGEDSLEVIVSIGAELTTVAVRDGGVPRFIRTLTVGGNRLTHSLADGMHLELATAERLKRGVVPPDHPQLSQARRNLGGDIRDLAEDVRATVDFFSTQAEGREIERLLITGGASQTQGLAAAIAGDLPVEVFQIAPFAGLDVADLGLDPDGLARASCTSTTAVGLALWPVESPLIRLSVLPEEVVEGRRSRKLMQMAGLGVAGLVGLLVVLGGVQVLRVHDANAHLASDNRQIADLNSEVSTLQAQTAVHGEAVNAAQTEISALTGDIDWVRVIGQLSAAMPADVHITSFSGTRTDAPGAAATSGSTTPGIGTISVAVSGSANADGAADWLDDLARDGDLTGTTISGISVTTGASPSVTFSSTSDLTTDGQSSRAKAVKQ